MKVMTREHCGRNSCPRPLQPVAFALESEGSEAGHIASALRSRRLFAAFTLVEILVTVLIAALIGIPLVAMLQRSDVQTVVSEDYMFAETLAQRHLEEALSMDVEELLPRLPTEKSLELFPRDERKLFGKYEEYGKNIGGSDAFRGRLVVSEAAEGLIRYEVHIEWPTAPGSRKMRRLVLVRFRCLPSLSLRMRPRLGDGNSVRRELRRLP